MPKFNGVFAYPLEVLLHLLWCYFVYIFVLSFFISIPFLIDWWIGNDAVSYQCGLVCWVSSSRWHLFLGAHFLIIFWFRDTIWPRFPYISALLTFVLSATFGSAMFAGARTLDTSQYGNFWQWLAGFAGMTVLAGACDRFNYYWGGGSGAPLSIVRRFGWLINGRAAYDAFVEQEAVRMHCEYDTHRRELKRNSHETLET